MTNSVPALPPDHASDPPARHASHRADGVMWWWAAAAAVAGGLAFGALMLDAGGELPAAALSGAVAAAAGLSLALAIWWGVAAVRAERIGRAAPAAGTRHDAEGMYFSRVPGRYTGLCADASR